jgi:hypothetical protein
MSIPFALRREVTVSGAPFPDGIVLICVMATRGRTNARSGGLRAADLKCVDGLRQPAPRDPG